MLQEEVFVAPALVRLVAFLPAEGLAQRARRAMPVQHVFVDRVVRREIEAAAEPPRDRLPVAHRAEVAHVGVRRGDVRVARMEDERDADRAPCRAGELRARRGRRGRQLRARHIGEADARLLEHRAVAQDARASAAAFGPRPHVFAEPRDTVHAFDRRADAVLQIGQIAADAGETGVVFLVGGRGHARHSRRRRAARLHSRRRGTPCASRISIAASSAIRSRRPRPGRASVGSPRTARNALA